MPAQCRNKRALTEELLEPSLAENESGQTGIGGASLDTASNFGRSGAFAEGRITGPARNGASER
jgi:hypothetical protein